jgi:hypothetical protein
MGKKEKRIVCINENELRITKTLTQWKASIYKNVAWKIRVNLWMDKL